MPNSGLALTIYLRSMLGPVILAVFLWIGTKEHREGVHLPKITQLMSSRAGV